MKLQIENWIIEKGYSNNVKGLFNESVICYRNGACRGSLIFSYIGFLTIIKETIIKAQRPSNFAEPEWGSLIQKINNDEYWEKEVYEALIRVVKPIFPLNENLREQLRYWKDRRNDCAHYKDNEIESHHTESFWSFIKSNLPKMTVEGGLQSLLNKFEEHFDLTRTPPNYDYGHLVKEIEHSVLSKDLHIFFERLDTTLEMTYMHTEATDISCKILDITSAKIQESMIEYLKKKNRDIKFLSLHPEKIQQLNYLPAEIRKIWKSRMHLNTSYYVNPFNIYAGMLKNNLVPHEEIDEANREVFNTFSQTSYHKLPEKKDIDTLKANGYYDTVFQIAIEEKNLTDFKWVNSKCDLIINFIENSPLKEKTVICILEMANTSNPSQWLIKALNDLLSTAPTLKEKFKAIALSSRIPISPLYKL